MYNFRLVLAEATFLAGITTQPCPSACSSSMEAAEETQTILKGGKMELNN